MTANTFWDWFQINSPKLERFLKSDLSDFSMFHILTDKIKSYSDLLIPEMTIDNDGNYVLIISCEGMPDGIPFVEKLADSAPIIPNWKIQKYRSAREPQDLNYQGLNFKFSDIKINHSVNDKKIDIDVYIKDYDKSDNRYLTLAFLYLDHTLGEYNVMTMIGEINFKKPGMFTSTSKMIKLDELNEVLSRLKMWQ